MFPSGHGTGVRLRLAVIVASMSQVISLSMHASFIVSKNKSVAEASKLSTGEFESAYVTLTSKVIAGLKVVGSV